MAYKQTPGRSPFLKTGRGIPLNMTSPLHKEEKKVKTKAEPTTLKNVNITASDPLKDLNTQSFNYGKSAYKAHKSGNEKEAKHLKQLNISTRRDANALAFERNKAGTMSDTELYNFRKDPENYFN